MIEDKHVIAAISSIFLIFFAIIIVLLVNSRPKPRKETNEEKTTIKTEEYYEEPEYTEPTATPLSDWGFYNLDDMGTSDKGIELIAISGYNTEDPDNSFVHSKWDFEYSLRFEYGYKMSCLFMGIGDNKLAEMKEDIYVSNTYDSYRILDNNSIQTDNHGKITIFERKGTANGFVVLDCGDHWYVPACFIDWDRETEEYYTDDGVAGWKLYLK